MIRIYLDTNLLVTWLLWKIYPRKYPEPFIVKLLSEHKTNLESYVSIITQAELFKVLKYDEKFSGKRFDSKVIRGFIDELQSIVGFGVIENISDDVDGVRVSSDILKFVEKHPHILDCIHVDIAKYNELTFVTSEDRIGNIRSIYDDIMTDNKLRKQFA